MIICPREPSADDNVSATWVRELVRYVRAITPLPGPGVKTQRTPNGTHLSCSPAARRGGASGNNGCWKIVNDSRNETVDNETVATTVRVFANQYYLDGECLHSLELTDAVEDFVCQGELAEGEEYTEEDKPYVCLKVPSTTDTTTQPTLEGYKELSDLQSAMQDPAFVIVPLYKFTHSGSVDVDFRNCPEVQVGEALP